MKFFNKLSVISLIVLMFSFMNVAGAAGDIGDCQGYAVNSCDQSKTSDKCNNSYRYTPQPSLKCQWDNSKAACRATGATCTSSAGLCKSNADCPSGQTCSGSHCFSN